MLSTTPITHSVFSIPTSNSSTVVSELSSKNPSTQTTAHLKTSLNTTSQSAFLQGPAQNLISTLPLTQPETNEHSSPITLSSKVIKPIGPSTIFELSIGRLTIGKQLGHGTFAIVHKAQLQPYDKPSPISLALKLNKLEESQFDTRDNQLSLENEINVLKKIAELDLEDCFPFIKHVVSFGYGQHVILGLYLCIENLYQRLKRARNQRLTFLDTIKIGRQLASGIEFLSRREISIAHCDLKPENILFESAQSLKLRIADFGAACQVPNNNLFQEYVVTRSYRPPEIVLGLPFDNSVDIWSMACVLYFAYTGQDLFEAKNSDELLNMFIHFLGPLPKEMANEFFIECADNPGFYDLPSSYKCQIGVTLREAFEKVFLSEATNTENDNAQELKELLEGIFKWQPHNRMNIYSIAEFLSDQLEKANARQASEG